MKKEKIPFYFLIIFLFFFLVLLFAYYNGYYQTKNTKTKILTEEQIKVFESDIKNGKEIDIDEYVTLENKDYSNKLSIFIYKSSLKLEKIIDNSVKYIFKKAGEVVEE